MRSVLVLVRVQTPRSLQKAPEMQTEQAEKSRRTS